MKGRMVLVLVMTVLFAALSWGCDMLEEDRDIGELIHHYAEQENITMRYDGHEEGNDDGGTIISYRDNDKHHFRMVMVEGDEESNIDYYIHYADETLSYWLYFDDEEMASDTDVPYDDDMAKSLIEAIEVVFFRPGDMDPAWFQDTGTMLELLTEHEESFLEFISDGDYDPERDELVSFEFEITETTYRMEIVIEEDGVVYENVVTMFDIGGTTVELPQETNDE